MKKLLSALFLGLFMAASAPVVLQAEDMPAADTKADAKPAKKHKHKHKAKKHKAKKAKAADAAAAPADAPAK